MDAKDSRSAAFRVRSARLEDIPALMRLKRLLAQGENALHAVCASEADWRRDGFGPNAGFLAFVAEDWNGPVIFLQDLFVEPHCRQHGVASALMARVATLARDVGSPIVELTVRADNPAQNFYLRTGFQPLPHCLTFVLAGPALAALADQDGETLALAG
jgi:GNAT superfamily N-acetyltransferase